VGKKCFEAYHGRSEPCEVCPTIKTLQDDTFQVDIVPKRGRHWEISGWLELYSYPLRDTMSGQTRGVIEYVRDITEEKQAEKRILDIKSHLETVLNGISESIVVVDRKYNIISCNRAFQCWVGKPKMDFRGMKCYDVIHGYTGPCRRCVVRDVFKTGKPSESIHYHQTEKGRVYHETKAFPILGGEVIEHIIYVFRDVTERELMKEQARQNYEQLLKANEELRKLDKMKTDFLSIASHELRTPLSIIKGYADILSSGTLGEVNPEQRSKLDRISGNVEHLNLLVRNILDLTRMDAGELKLTKQRFSLEHMVDEVIGDMSHLASEKKIKLTSEMRLKSKVLADRGRIKQLMVNLLDNALKFTPSGGRVGVSAVEDSDSLIIKVSDNGIGIRKKDLENIFRRFYQVDSSYQRRYKGAGLGLAICKRIVELHGGEIKVKSRFGEGTTLSVKLPLNNRYSGLHD
jgi:signal transduction histidine kinase